MAETTDNNNKKDEAYVAVIRIRGEVALKGDIKDTLRMLGVPNKNNMAIHKKTSSIMGMVKKASGFITFGDVSKDLADKYGLKKTIPMHPPRGGFERKGIKVPFNVGGALGDRGDKMADLIEKMKI
ncbi:MAG: uL30 family ribosomal protein [Candidatus Woesearchaeota archaeon]